MFKRPCQWQNQRLGLHIPAGNFKALITAHIDGIAIMPICIYLDTCTFLVCVSLSRCRAWKNQVQC